MVQLRQGCFLTEEKERDFKLIAKRQKATVLVLVSLDLNK